MNKIDSDNFLSPDQKTVLINITSWINNPTPYLLIGGYAGTGKTTLIGHFRKILGKERKKLRVSFACPTGMASQNLFNRLQLQMALNSKDYVGTIHRLIYNPEVDKNGRILRWQRNEDIKTDLLIIDEGSMITESVWKDLLSYKIPILVMGDHGQLPPIGDSFNLMEKCDLTLEHIHRQAIGNPIIDLATKARLGEPIDINKYTSGVQKLDRNSYEANEISDSFFLNKNTDSLILCGTNKLRKQLNNHIRKSQDFETLYPTVNDKVVCLKNIYTNKEGPIFNGMVGKIKSIMEFDKHRYQAVIYFDSTGTHYDGLISKKQFGEDSLLSTVDGLSESKIGDRFDFGYALTVHKAQGSQAKKVLIFDESSYFRESAHKWLYTAITRAQEELYILGN